MTAVTASADLDVPAATFDDGLAHFYRYVTAAGREVRFFVMKSRDGKVRAALDADGGLRMEPEVERSLDVAVHGRLRFRQQAEHRLHPRSQGLL